MLKEVLEQALKPEHKKAGLYLEEDEDFLYLVKNGKTLCLFSAPGATIQSIWQEADKYIEGVGK